MILKLSGEALADPTGENISGEVLKNLASEIASVREVHAIDIVSPLYAMTSSRKVPRR